MSRPIVLSNGEMHIGLDEMSHVADFYYPYVGGENHVASRDLRHRIGVWVDGVFSWCDGPDWQAEQSYLDETLIGVSTLENNALGIMLEFTDTVDSGQSAFLRNIQVINTTDRARDVRLFLHQLLEISNSNASDTAQYLPDDDAIVHYKGLRTFITSGRAEGKPFDQFVVGLNGIEGHDGSYRDAEDGELSGNAIEHGRVDSVIRFSLTLSPHDSSRVHYWIAAGKSQREALLIHKKIVDEGILHRMLLTANYWHEWLKPANDAAEQMDVIYRKPFLQSVLLIKSHLDKRGAVIASTDTTMLNYSKDSYSYCWPRDGALVMWPLIRLGYVDEPLHFFMFCRRILTSGGYLMHKYQPDGALGSSWHPYIHDGIIAPPIQEDESAIVLFLFAQYYLMRKDEKLLREFYPTFVSPIANFLASYIGKNDLPKPSYDLWEEVFQTSTYTVATVYGALDAAAHLADVIGEAEDALRWRTAAEQIQLAAQKQLIGDDGTLVKGIKVDGGQDITLDSSSGFAGFMFGLFDVNDKVVANTFTAMSERLRSGGGLARYEHDYYNRTRQDSIGNPWHITTLWYAQYLLEMERYDEAKAEINWTLSYMMQTGVLAEQLDPDTGAPLSVAPLTWSQAELASCLLDTIDRSNA